MNGIKNIPFSVLDLSPVFEGETAADALRHSLSLARTGGSIVGRPKPSGEGWRNFSNNCGPTRLGSIRLLTITKNGFVRSSSWPPLITA